MIVRIGSLASSSKASSEGDATPGGAANVVLRAGGSSGILKAGGAGYIKKAG
jgi:hypothetical protein